MYCYIPCFEYEIQIIKDYSTTLIRNGKSSSVVDRNGSVAKGAICGMFNPSHNG